MQKWEYLVQQFKSPSELLTLLNKLGDEGWELVTLLAEDAATQSQILAKAQLPANRQRQQAQWVHSGVRCSDGKVRVDVDGSPDW